MSIQYAASIAEKPEHIGHLRVDNSEANTLCGLRVKDGVQMPLGHVWVWTDQVHVLKNYEVCKTCAEKNA